MTRRQKIYLDIIKDFIVKNGYSPRYKEIAALAGVRSLNSVELAVHNLASQGMIALEGWGAGMSIRLVPQKQLEMNSCKRHHPRIWFMESSCPMCELLQSIAVQTPGVPPSQQTVGEGT